MCGTKAKRGIKDDRNCGASAPDQIPIPHLEQFDSEAWSWNWGLNWRNWEVGISELHTQAAAQLLYLPIISSGVNSFIRYSGTGVEPGWTCLS